MELNLKEDDSQNYGPLVSVFVPSYNHQNFVAQCIRSIVNQSYRNFELIVIDDGSTDDSRSVLLALQSEYSFRLVFQENIGLPKTMNRVIKEFAKGKYFTACASDDYWVPDKLDKQVKFMEANPDIPMCFGKAYVVDETDRIDEKLTIWRNKNLKGGDIFKDIILMNFHLPVNYLFRKTVFDEAGYYRDDIFTEDFYMNLRLASRYNIGYIDEFLFYYRVAADPNKKLANTKSALAHLECLREYNGSMYYEEAIRRWNLRTFLWYSPYKKHKLFAFFAMFRSLKFFFTPSYFKALVKFVFVWR